MVPADSNVTVVIMAFGRIHNARFHPEQIVHAKRGDVRAMSLQPKDALAVCCIRDGAVPNHDRFPPRG